LILLWLAVQALPFSWLATGHYYHNEISEARKVLDYGFWARKGAYLYTEWSVGRLPNPWEHNYVNHPYPIEWLYTLLYWILGKAGIYALVAATGLAGCLLTYAFLKRFFPVRAAWVAAALYVTAHASVEFTANPDSIAQGAFVWPLAAWVIVRLRQGQERTTLLCEASVHTGEATRTTESHAPSRWVALALGLTVFFAGQTCWWALTTVPALMLLCLPEDLTLCEALRRPWAVRGWSPILIGGVASLACFIGQVFAYSPNLHSNAQYLLASQMRVGGSFLGNRVRMLPVLLLRMALAGPALWLGAFVSLTRLCRNQAEERTTVSCAFPRSGKTDLQPAARTTESCAPSSGATQRRLAWAMGFYLAIFCTVMLTIPTFLYLNQHGFRFVLFPCAVLTAFVLTRLDRARWLRLLLAGVALPALLLCYAKLHDFQESSASVALGNWLASRTKPEEVVFTNLKYPLPPIQKWDVEFQACVRNVSDRLFFLAENDAELLRVAAPLAGQLQRVCFLKESGQPLATDLAGRLDAGAATTTATNLPVPTESLRPFKSGRAALWNVLRFYGHPPPSAPATNAFNLTLYRLSPAAVRQLEEDLRATVLTNGVAR
jgi:hypothetical protein